jgi:signal peptidase II
MWGATLLIRGCAVAVSKTFLDPAKSAGTPETMTGRTAALVPWLGIAALVALADQSTKKLIESALQPGESRAFGSFFNLVLAYNRGAAFSFLADASGWQRPAFVVVALAAIVLILWLLTRHAGNRLFCLALALILGGALGNLWDRATLGHVVDFLDFHAAGYHWPAFNVADSAITVGAALLIFDGFRTQRRGMPTGSG